MSAWTPVVAALIAALIPAFFTYRQSVRASTKMLKEAAEQQREEGRKVEAEAYARAKKIYEDGFKLLEEQVAGLRFQLDTERDVSTEMRRRVAKLEESLSRLRQQMLLAGIEPLDDEHLVPEMHPEGT